MRFITTSLGVLWLGASAAFAQATAFSKPSGFVTHTLVGGQFNLIGLTLHEPVVISGSLEEVSGTDLKDNDVDFSSVLTEGKTYILEIVENAGDPSLVGAIQQVVNWDANTMTTSGDLGARGLAAGAKYQLRAAKSISDVFGPNNEAGLQASAGKNIEEADVLYVPNGDGFDAYFYSTAEGESGWYLSNNLSSASDPSLVSVDAILIHRRGTDDLDLVMHGCVKSTVSSFVLKGGSFNYVSTVFPAGATLGNSGLAASVAASGDYSIGQADVVYMQNGAGGYDRYFYSNAPGDAKWCSDGFDDASNVPMRSGIIIQRRGGDTHATITPPPSYSNF